MSYCATYNTGEILSAGHLGELTRVILPELVDDVLDTVGGKEHRFRRLPSRVVVYLLLAGALFAGQGWLQVWSRMTASAPIFRPSKSSITQAMRRVGVRPLRELFNVLAGPAACLRGQVPRFAGRMVLAIDGTQIAVPDTEANLIAFPKPRGGPNGPAGYPMIRLVALVTTGTRSIIDAVFGTDRVGELSYAATLARALQPGMLLLGDRNFATYRFFSQITDTGADFLIRGKTGRGAMKLPVAQRLPDGSYLSRAAGVLVRVVDATVTITTRAETKTSQYRLITTLLNPGEASAEQLVRLYHDRWEIETAYCELKSTLLGGRVLRSRYPSGIEQEVWALLITHKALRLAMSDAILTRPDLTPDRLSFTIALNTARDQIVRTADVIGDTAIDLIGCIGAAVLHDLVPTRGPRTRQRVVKRAISKYRAKGPRVDRHTYPATLRTQIHPPAPEP